MRLFGRYLWLFTVLGSAFGIIAANVLLMLGVKHGTAWLVSDVFVYAQAFCIMILLRRLLIFNDGQQKLTRLQMQYQYYCGKEFESQMPGNGTPPPRDREFIDSYFKRVEHLYNMRKGCTSFKDVKAWYKEVKKTYKENLVDIKKAKKDWG